MLKALIKLPLKVAFYPLKLALEAAGILRDDPAPRPVAPSAPRPPQHQPAPEPDVPDDIEVEARTVLAAPAGARPTVFVDVREAQELAASGKIEGAVHIPLRDMPRRYEELDKADTIVLYCAAGMRSYNAAMFLRDKGYDGARSLTSGLPAWTAAGGSLVDG